MENGLVDRGWGEGEDGLNPESGVDIYTLP